MLNEYGIIERVPAHWSLLPPGDAALSRRIKADGPSWVMSEMKGRKRFSRGIWAPADRIGALRVALLKERADPAYQRKLAAGRQRRMIAETLYAEDFRCAVLDFLCFNPRYEADAAALAVLIANHATPVGSGTVARTERIPLQQRAEAATIAWLRHQTTAYDNMQIPPIKGRRRAMRRLLAQRSHELLKQYREGQAIDPLLCPLQGALRKARPQMAVLHSSQKPVQGLLI